MFERLGRAVARVPRLVILVWLLAAGAAFVFAPSLRDVGKADETSFLPRDAESMTARALLARAFPAESAAGTATLVLVREPGPLTDGDRAYLASLADWTTGPDAPSAVRDAVIGIVTAESAPGQASLLRSPDGTTEIATVRLRVAAFQQDANDAVVALRGHIAATAPAGLAVHVTGSAGIGTDYLQAIIDGTDRTTVVTVVLVVLILLLIYRAPMAALVPLLTIGAAYLVARGSLGWLAAAGWSVSTLIDSFIVVLVFGVGTDYTIFLVSRYREELARAGAAAGDDAARGVAIEATVGRIGAVITASAATVVVGLSSMIVARFGMIQTTGPALALAIVVTLAAGLTLAPALLLVFGRSLFWPRHPRPMTGGPDGGLWDRIAGGIVRRPLLVSAVVIAALAVPILILPGTRTNFDTLAELPASSDSRQGFDAVAAHLDKGQLLPITIVVEDPGTDLASGDGLAAIAATSGRLAALDGVASVRSLAWPNGDGVPEELRPSVRLGQLSAAFEAGATGGSTGDLTAGITWLRGLGTAVPLVADDPRYAAALQDLATLTATMTRIQAGGLSSQEALQLRAEASTTSGRIATDLRELGLILAADPIHDIELPTGAGAAAIAQLRSGYVSADGSIARFIVVTKDDPYATGALDTVERIRASLAAAPATFGAGATIAVGGPTAEFRDIQATIESDFRSVAIITVVGILLVLIVLLRSVVAPLFLVGTVLLSYWTTLHLAGGLFQDVLGQAGANYFLPLLVFVLLVALGSDYNIFVTSRIREESARRPIREGIRVAAARTGMVVSSAGIILAGTFAALTTAPLELLFQVGAAVAMGVLLDTFVVRSLLVPALTAVFGGWSWWPSGMRGRPPAPRPTTRAAASSR